LFTDNQKMKAVKVYIKYYCKTASLLRELEYPKDRLTLIKLYREYIKNVDFGAYLLSIIILYTLKRLGRVIVLV